MRSTEKYIGKFNDKGPKDGMGLEEEEEKEKGKGVIRLNVN